MDLIFILQVIKLISHITYFHVTHPIANVTKVCYLQLEEGGFIGEADEWRTLMFIRAYSRVV